MARARVNELTAECASLAAWTEQEKVECYTLAARICELEVDAATHDAELSLVLLARRLLKAWAEAGEDRANNAEAGACETMDKMYKLQQLVEGLNQIVSGECGDVAGLVRAELVCVRSVITAALSGGDGTVSKAICDVHNRFPVEASSDALSPSAGLSACLIMLRSR